LLTGYMALYKRLFVNITRAVYIGSYNLSTIFITNNWNVTIIQWKTTLQTCSILNVYIRISLITIAEELKINKMLLLNLPVLCVQGIWCPQFRYQYPHNCWQENYVCLQKRKKWSSTMLIVCMSKIFIYTRS
jgi:hypothetical protein